ncbi:endonuclease III [Pseudobacteriovorax antillogorgiicola]|uniref:endonuclease III n=1 Tax=Pseudobacteriovorax antillogorgiicola TaxID=1513793 RepID=UPI00190EEA0E|nr:endonuclease III [Pseudobacteriovorax antillogorgiicola]
MKSPNSRPRKKAVKRDFRPKGRPFSQAKRREIAEKTILRLRDLDPNPKCELFYKTQFQLLVSVVLSAQTTDKMVNRVMEPIYREGFTPETVVSWGQEALLEKIRTIGLAPTKAKNVFRLSQILIDQHKSRVPKTKEELEALPGVGRKTANVILGELFKHPTLAVDTHVYRVTMRLGLHVEANADKCEEQLLKVVNPKYLPAAHHWFILLGRYTCKAIKPNCDACQLTDICPSYPV